MFIPRNETHAALAERWPHLFIVPVPLKIGIHHEYPPEGERPVSKLKFRNFMWHWVRQPSYKAALDVAKARYDFEGRMWPVGEHHGGRK